MKNSKLLSDFYALIDRLNGKREGEVALEMATDWMKGVTKYDLINYLTETIRDDASKLYSSIISSPPDIIPIGIKNGYTFDLICWRDSNKTGLHEENEDIHDHFCYIVSKAIVGSPYREIVYRREKSEKLSVIRDESFDEDCINIIAPDTIHQVFYLGRPPALSIRIVFPSVKEVMKVYDDNGAVLKTLNNGLERKMLELSKALNLLDDNVLSQYSKKIKNEVLNLNVFDFEITE